jgi:hypothetical protein
MNVDLTHGSIFRGLLRFSLPLMDGILIFEQDVSTEDENALREAFQAENDALWSGIR